MSARLTAAERDTLRRGKLARLRSGATPRALEICSGCGGLSLGLKSAGFELTAHVEVDREAARSYALNFGQGRADNDPWLLPRNMESCSAAELAADLKLPASAAESFDLLAAGLPCQAFARIGRSKLRAVSGGQEDAFQKDPRAALYRRFLEYVEDTQPLVILIENVPDILNFGGHNVPEEICETLDEMGYRTGYTLLNAACHGVPQIRERLFIVALAEVLDTDPTFPVPARHLELPRGYEGTRSVALKHVDRNSGHFHEIVEPGSSLPSAVGVRDALADLPWIREHINDPRTMRRRKLTEILPYRELKKELSAYAQLMRGWEGFETDEQGTDGHLVRITPRDFQIFAAMQHGGDYPHALEQAENLFKAACKAARIPHSGKRTAAWKKLRAEHVPPYDPGKFPNKWWKLDPANPSRTLTAHMGKDTYSHIHYDSAQQRTVSVREAARLQSFPDGFRFFGAMNAAFRQIGNAVPPLLGLAVARILRGQLDEAAKAKLDSSRKAA